jgi:hypothetical protein
MPKKWILLLAAIGVGLKFLSGATADPRDPKKFVAAVGSHLVRDGYLIDDVSYWAEPMISAHRGACRLRLTEARVQGWNTSNLTRLAAEEGRLVYVWGGRTSSEAPVWRATATYLTARLLRQFGLSSAWTPILAVIAAPGCEAGDIPIWDVKVS